MSVGAAAKGKEEDEEKASLLCWGSGEHSQHGHAYSDPATYGVDVPSHVGKLRLDVDGAKTAAVRMVACGSSHTVVLTEDDEMYAWGHGYSESCSCKAKNLNASSTSRLTFAAAAAATGGSRCNVVAGLECGGRQTVVWLKSGCAWSVESNDLHCCPSADSFQDGKVDPAGTNCGVASVPSTLTLHPVPLLNTLPVTKVACGDRHSIFLLQNGDLYASGNNTYGQLGTGDRIEARAPVKTDIELAQLIACGAHHSMAVSTNGDLFVWGYGKAIGDKDADILVPTRKVKHHTNITAIAAGGAHCLALTANGNVYSWGVGVDGQLGHGPEENFVSVPRKLGDKRLCAQIAAISAGDLYSAAITANGELYMWGKNSHTIDYHQVAAARIYTPVKVNTSGLPVKAVVCGTWHAACIVGKPEMLKNDYSSDSASCWGDDPETENMRIAKEFNRGDDVLEDSPISRHFVSDDVVLRKKAHEQQRPKSRGPRRRDITRHHAGETLNTILSGTSNGNIRMAPETAQDNPAVHTNKPTFSNSSERIEDSGSSSTLGLVGAKRIGEEQKRTVRDAQKTIPRRDPVNQVVIDFEQPPQQDPTVGTHQSAHEHATEGLWAALDTSDKDPENPREASADDHCKADDIARVTAASMRTSQLQPTAASRGQSGNRRGAPSSAARRSEEVTKRALGSATHARVSSFAMVETQATEASSATSNAADGRPTQPTLRRMSFDLDANLSGYLDRSSKAAQRLPGDWSSHSDLTHSIAHNKRAVPAEQHLPLAIGAARRGERLPPVGEGVGIAESYASPVTLYANGTISEGAKTISVSSGSLHAHSNLKQSHGANGIDRGGISVPLDSKAMRGRLEKNKVVSSSSISSQLEVGHNSATTKDNDGHLSAIERLSTSVSPDVTSAPDKGHRRGVTSGVDKTLAAGSHLRTPATVGFIDDRIPENVQPRQNGVYRQRTVSIPPRDVYNSKLAMPASRHRSSVSQQRAAPQLRRSQLSREPLAGLSRADRMRTTAMCEELLVISVKSAPGDSAIDADITFQPAGSLRCAPAQHS